MWTSTVTLEATIEDEHACEESLPKKLAPKLASALPNPDMERQPEALLGPP
jgi:hypothetical protein